MPLVTYPAETALKNLKSRTAIWPARGKSNRKGCLPLPQVTPSFHICDTDRIFCMGSCFAAHIGFVLRALGFEVVTEQPHPLLQGDHGGSNHLIRYNAYSILNELRWAAKPVDFEQLFVEESDGLFTDPHAHHPTDTYTKERLRALRQFTSSVTQRWKECRVLLLTLGLIEVWYDEKNQLYTNLQPSRHAMQKEPGRFALHVLSFDDIMRALEEIHALLARYGHTDVRMLVTTSPVPLQSTYSGQDIFIANTQSKSVQRAALGEFVVRHSNVAYFPSYETVTLGHPDLAWKDDQRHVTEPVVQLIMEHVVRSYAPHTNIQASMTERFRKLDEQLNGIPATAIWEKMASLSAQVAALRAENDELKRRGTPVLG